MKKTLLPVGFRDRLYPDALTEIEVISSLARNFDKQGYKLVAPPMMEFDSSLLDGPGKNLEENTFRVLDPVSHKMLAIRADMTGQIARLAESRLADEPVPLKLSYVGQVFRMRQDKGNGLRQFTQAGIELMGEDSVEADCEVVNVAINVLEELGIKGICIDFTLPKLTEILLDELSLEAGDREQVLRALRKKDIAAIKGVLKDDAELFVKLASPDIKTEDLLDLFIPAKAKELCKRLDKVVTKIKKDAPGINVTIDPIESSSIGYYTGMGFSIFSSKAKDELGKGGRYKSNADDKLSNGVGMTLYVNNLLPLAENI